MYGRIHRNYIPGLVAGKESVIWWLKNNLSVGSYQILGMNKKEHIPATYPLLRNETSRTTFQFGRLSISYDEENSPFLPDEG